jgi:hypothetical protein
MVQNLYDLSTIDQSLSSVTEAARESKVLEADLQVPWILASRLQGELLLPGNDDYEAVRTVWNAAFDRHPALIVRCLTVADVMTAVTFAREHHLVVSVRSGGHSPAGFGTNDGGMVIDLSRMKGITIDPAQRTARLELERGKGGDHDTQYRFTLPISVKEQLVWADLQTRVQAGELPS